MKLVKIIRIGKLWHSKYRRSVWSGSRNMASLIPFFYCTAITPWFHTACFLPSTYFAELRLLVSNILYLKSNNYILSFLVFLSSFSVNLWGIFICQFFSSLGPFKDILTRSSSDGVLEKISNKASNEKNDIFHGTKFGFGKTFY